MRKPKKWDSMTPEQQAAWLENHQRRSREKRRKFNKANPGRKRELNRNWRKANPEKNREQNRKYREAHREKRREQDRRRYEANPEKNREKNRKRYENKCSADVFMQMTAAAAELSQKQEPTENEQRPTD